MADDHVKLDKFHWHEALDRTHIVADMFETFIVEHPVFKQTPALKARADEISAKLGALYQAIPNMGDKIDEDAK
jgi:hypothetical protein